MELPAYIGGSLPGGVEGTHAVRKGKSKLGIDREGAEKNDYERREGGQKTFCRPRIQPSKGTKRLTGEEIPTWRIT